MIALSDSGLPRRTTLHAESKKARVLKLVQRDPFLSVDEIADLVGTTSRYVRTSLSEAGLTLTGLRRRYAEDMKQRLNNASGDRGDEHYPGDSPVDSPEHSPGDSDRSGTGGPRVNDAADHIDCVSLRVAQTIDPEAAALLGTDAQTPLLEISRIHVQNGEPLCIHQLVTTQPLTAGERLLAADVPLHSCLGRMMKTSRAFSEKRIVDIVPATEFMAECFGLTAGHPILRSGTVITVGQRPVAVEFKYFDGMRVRFELDSASPKEPLAAERVHRKSLG